MKKTSLIMLVIISCITVFFLGFTYEKSISPNMYYQIYLDDEIIGVISNANKLEEYIDKESFNYKKKYGVKKVYPPEGLKIVSINTYKGKIDKVQKIYEKLKNKKPFTIEGYQLTINQEEPKKIYALKEEVFKESLEEVAAIYAGEENYQLYKNKTQPEINGTGEKIENIYIQEEMTIKKTKISVLENIYTTSKNLTSYLLFGENNEKIEYEVKVGDTIEQIALDNEISTSEFLISNPSFSNKNNLLFPGQKVMIGVTNPKVKVVVEKYIIEDVESEYKTEEKYDSSKNVGYVEVFQTGEKGLERVSRNVQIINGVITYAKSEPKEILKPVTNEIIIYGSKKVNKVGNLSNWSWPTDSGWMITQDYEYRINPISGRREFHQALDISGTGYGSNIYSVNNGIVTLSQRHYQYGYYVIINHNNGYETLYAHLSKPANVKVGETVAKGQILGYMGSTGWSSGPHLHFEVLKNGNKINPWNIYR